MVVNVDLGFSSGTIVGGLEGGIEGAIGEFGDALAKLSWIGVADGDDSGGEGLGTGLRVIGDCGMAMMNSGVTTGLSV